MVNFYVVATPIGDYDDITIKAINILKKVDFIVCESEKEYRKLFNFLGIKEKKFVLCNEHDENEAIELVMPLLKNSELGALISDCGTPLFEDPGFDLLDAIRKNGYRISAVPGASSIMTALSLSPFKIDRFYYAGLLPRKNEERDKALRDLLVKEEAIVIIEAPYRLKNILSSLEDNLSSRRLFLSYNLTMNDEKTFWGSVQKVKKDINDAKIDKGEFLVIIEAKSIKNKKMKKNKKIC